MSTALRSLVFGLLACCAASAAAQSPTVTISRSPIIEAVRYGQADSQAASHVAGAYRLVSSGGISEVDGFVLGTDGSGNWATDLDPTAGVRIWLDDGDEQFDELLDTLLFQGAPGTSINAVFLQALVVPDGSHVDLWVQLIFAAGAGIGATEGLSYGVGLASAADVIVPAQSSTAAALGSPQPWATIRLVEFFVTSFTPLSDMPAGGNAITINGGGLMPPLWVTIGGISCPGSPALQHGYTEVTGLTVPSGSGTNLPIVIYVGDLSITLTQTFDYVPLPPPPPPPSTLVEIVTTSLPPGEVGVPYTATIRCTGGTGSYTWGSGLSAGALPQSLFKKPVSVFGSSGVPSQGV